MCVDTGLQCEIICWLLVTCSCEWDYFIYVKECGRTVHSSAVILQIWRPRKRRQEKYMTVQQQVMKGLVWLGYDLNVSQLTRCTIFQWCKKMNISSQATINDRSNYFMVPTFADTNTWKCTSLWNQFCVSLAESAKKNGQFPRFGNISRPRAPYSLPYFKLFRVNCVESEEDFQWKMT